MYAYIITIMFRHLVIVQLYIHDNYYGLRGSLYVSIYI